MPAEANRFEVFKIDELKTLRAALAEFAGLTYRPGRDPLEVELWYAIVALESGWGVSICAQCGWQWRLPEGAGEDHAPDCPTGKGQHQGYDAFRSSLLALWERGE